MRDRDSYLVDFLFEQDIGQRPNHVEDSIFLSRLVRRVVQDLDAEAHRLGKHVLRGEKGAGCNSKMEPEKAVMYMNLTIIPSIPASNLML